MTGGAGATGVVVDSSAAMAVLQSEPELEGVLAVLEAAEVRLLSSATLVELAIVAEARFGAAGPAAVDRLLRDGGIDVVALDRTHADRAIEGWRRFGKGRHPAALNLGDCFTYGLAIALGYAILCVDVDFRLTDAPVAELET